MLVYIRDDQAEVVLGGSEPHPQAIHLGGAVYEFPPGVPGGVADLVLPVLSLQELPVDPDNLIQYSRVGAELQQVNGAVGQWRDNLLKAIQQDLAHYGVKTVKDWSQNNLHVSVWAGSWQITIIPVSGGRVRSYTQPEYTQIITLPIYPATIGVPALHPVFQEIAMTRQRMRIVFSLPLEEFEWYRGYTERQQVLLGMKREYRGPALADAALLMAQPPYHDGVVVRGETEVIVIHKVAAHPVREHERPPCFHLKIAPVDTSPDEVGDGA
ncbi:hypothetical protein [Thermogutta sp.]|jgi:hypothetical protein|uniref:hypothetical protein n=1 Tax=Thermogutta sp. TaxID=1962930 RepID=UPI00321FA5E7